MKFLKYEDRHFYFHVNNYHIALQKEWIENGWISDESFTVNDNFDLSHDSELRKKYHAKEISKDEINKHIEEIREKYPELLL